MLDNLEKYKVILASGSPQERIDGRFGREL